MKIVPQKHHSLLQCDHLTPTHTDTLPNIFSATVSGTDCYSGYDNYALQD